MVVNIPPRKRITALCFASLQVAMASIALGTLTNRSQAQSQTVPTLEPPPQPQTPLPPPPPPDSPLPRQTVPESVPSSAPPQTFSPSNPPPAGYSPPPFEDSLTNQFTVYRLDVGDAVRITVREFPEFSFQSVVDTEGNVIAPILGRVSVVGLTTDEVEAKFRFELNSRFLKEPPEVIATLAGIRPVRITVVGEVVRPGFYTVAPNSVLTNILATAGGSTEAADLRSVIVRRPSVDGAAIEEQVDLYTPLQNGASIPDIRIQGGDTVIVSRLEVGDEEDYDRTLVARTTLPQQQITVRVLVPSGTGTALRNLRLNNGSTFLDVIASLPSSDPVLINRDAIALLRFDPERGKVVTQKLDSQAAIKGDISQNVPLRDEDVIVVNRSLIGKIFNTFNTITQPIRSFFGLRTFIRNIDNLAD